MVMKTKHKIIGTIKNVLLLITAIVLVVITSPFYVVYAFGKTLCDKDEWSYFYDSLWEMLLGLKDVSGVKSAARMVNRENEKLKQYIEDIKKAADKAPENTAAKYNAMWDVIYKYNEEFNIDN